jgi:phosphatidylglycerol:prolipoprotein diacylglycerol transferase
MLFASVVIGRALAIRFGERAGVHPRLAERCCLWTLLSAIVGARLLFVLTNFDQFDRSVEISSGGKAPWSHTGGSSAGSQALSCFAAFMACVSWHGADCAAPALCIGLSITRVGCFLAGCDFGRPWDGPWAVRFPAGPPAFTEQTLAGLLPAGATQSLPVHPTQPYESIAGLALLALMIAVSRRRVAWGQSLGVVVVGYAVLRFFIEIVRADAGRGFVGPLSRSQLIAIITGIAATALLLVLQRRRAASTSRERSMLPCATV